MENVLLVGSGGREHAIAKALVRDDRVRLFAALATSNPGVLDLAEATVDTETDAAAIVAFAKEHAVDLCVVGPEAPLAAGVSDALEAAGFPCASPTQAAARIESSKIFMRDLLDRHEVPGQIRYCQTTDLGEAIAFAEALEWQVAVKPVGLTSGKGVKVWGDHFDTPESATAYVREVLEQSVSGHDEVVVEELLVGQEFTLHFYCDGARALPTPLIQDHKRAHDGDKGPNTGGMGAYSCADGRLPFVTDGDYEAACRIGQRVVEAMAADGNPFKGVLYGQFMVTAAGPKVIEFNARFGDPEAINALSLLETPFVDVCWAMVGGGLADLDVRHRHAATLVLYVVPAGYGTSPAAGEKIVVDEAALAAAGAQPFYASCRLLDRTGEVVTIETTSSRTLGVYAEGETPDDARRNALRAIDTIGGRFTHRTDIGSAGVLAGKIESMRALRG
ncbi:MAG TPA: phosphoribosylamine--glycine ligase [Acidimicrobiales bacterium]